MALKPNKQSMGNSSIEMNWGTDINSLVPEITDFSKTLSSWGQRSAGGGIDFKMGEIPTNSFGLGNITPGSGEGNWQSKWLGGTNAQGMQTNGIIPVGINALSGLTSAYLGWQQFNLAKDQLAQNKKIFNLNFGNQAQSVNTQLEDRQRARVAGGGGAYESVDSYMAKNAVQTKGI